MNNSHFIGQAKICNDSGMAISWSKVANMIIFREFGSGLCVSDECGNRFFPTAATYYWQRPADIACQWAVFSEAYFRLCYVLRSGITNQELNWVHVNFRKLDIRICFKSFQYATHRPSGVMCHSSTVFDMLASPLLQFRKYGPHGSSSNSTICVFILLGQYLFCQHVSVDSKNVTKANFRWHIVDGDTDFLRTKDPAVQLSVID